MSWVESEREKLHHRNRFVYHFMFLIMYISAVLNWWWKHLSVGIGPATIPHVWIHHPIVMWMRRRMLLLLLLNYRENDPSIFTIIVGMSRGTYRVPIIVRSGGRCSSMWEIGWKSLMGRIIMWHMIMIEWRWWHADKRRWATIVRIISLQKRK